MDGVIQFAVIEVLLIGILIGWYLREPIKSRAQTFTRKSPKGERPTSRPDGQNGTWINGKPIGVTIGWGGWPRLLFADGKIVFSKNAELALYKEYYPLQRLDEWPVDPITRERLPKEGGAK